MEIYLPGEVREKRGRRVGDGHRLQRIGPD